MLSDEDDVN